MCLPRHSKKKTRFIHHRMMCLGIKERCSINIIFGNSFRYNATISGAPWTSKNNVFRRTWRKKVSESVRIDGWRVSFPIEEFFIIENCRKCMDITSFASIFGVWRLQQNINLTAVEVRHGHALFRPYMARPRSFLNHTLPLLSYYSTRYTCHFCSLVM